MQEQYLPQQSHRRAASKSRNISRKGAKAAKEKNDSELGDLGVLAGANLCFRELRAAGNLRKLPKR